MSASRTTLFAAKPGWCPRHTKRYRINGFYYFRGDPRQQDHGAVAEAPANGRACLICYRCGVVELPLLTSSADRRRDPHT